MSSRDWFFREDDVMEPGDILPVFWELERKPRLFVVEDDNDVGNLLKPGILSTKQLDALA